MTLPIGVGRQRPVRRVRPLEAGGAGPEAANPTMRLLATGPVLIRRKRRDLRRIVVVGLLVLVAAGAAWLSLRVIAADLAQGRHIHAGHADDGALGAAAAPRTASPTPIRPGGPLRVPAPTVLPAAPTEDPVARALLAAGRDHLARKVSATIQPEDDARANRGAAIDLIDRGLAGQLSLRQALPRHRALAPQRYGLRERPSASSDERRRALTAENLAIFLTTFAQQLDGQRDNLEAGDILLLERRHGVRRLLPGLVSDTVDSDGVPQVITLDPADRVAKEQPLAVYALRGHFRLRLDDVTRLRQTLELGAVAPGGVAL